MSAQNEEEHNALTAELEKANEEKAALEAELVEAKAAKEALDAQLAEAKEKLANSEELQKQLAASEIEVETLRSESEEKAGLVEDLTEQIKALPSQDELDDLKLKNAELTNMLNEKLAEISELRAQNEELEANQGATVVQENMFDVEKWQELQAQLDKKDAEIARLNELVVEVEPQQELVEESAAQSELEDVAMLEPLAVEEAPQGAPEMCMFDEERQEYVDKIAELEEVIERQLEDIEDLNQEIDALNNELVAKEDEQKDYEHELDARDAEIERLNKTIVELNAEVSNNNAYIQALENEKNIHSKTLENRIEELTSLVGTLSKAPKSEETEPASINRLRDEMNSRFAEQKQEKYNDEIRNLKDEIKALNGKLESKAEGVDPNADSFERDLVKGGNPYRYTKEDINNTRFTLEFNRLEKIIEGLHYDIEDDTRRYNSAVEKNAQAKERRLMMIDQINKEIDVFAEKYSNSQEGESIENKEIYEREKVKAAEKIRFHEEKIREISDSVQEALVNHEQYVTEKEKQIAKVRKQQQALIEYYGKDLFEQGILPKSYVAEQEQNRSAQLSNIDKLEAKLEELKKENELKENKLNELLRQREIDALREENEQELAIARRQSEEVKALRELQRLELEGKGNIVGLRKDFEEKKAALSKFKTEYERCALLEKELRTSDSMVMEYCKYNDSLEGLRSDLEDVRRQKVRSLELIEEYIGDPNKRAELMALRASRDDLSVREHDLLSKINYSTIRLENASKDSQVKKYQELVLGMKKIVNRMNSLKDEMIEIKQRLGA